MKKKKSSLITLIIPAYNQEKTIAKDLLRIASVMNQIRYNYEIIVVVDGKKDKTYENAKKVSSRKIFVTG